MNFRRRFVRKLHLEQLESRLAPSGTPWLAESFDLTPAGTLPSGWLTWNSGGASVTVANAAGVSGSHSLAVGSTASHGIAHAWYNVPATTDVEVSASVYLNSLIPAQVIARGSNLHSANSTYYALQVTRGLELDVVRVVNGTATVLGQINSASWFSDQWVRATLHIEGNQVRAQLVRADNGQYLGSGGQWQTAQAWALTVNDGTITQAGLVGVSRPASYTGTLNFDDFSVTNLSTPPAPTSTTENFDGPIIGSLPGGWTQYSSDGSAAFRVVNAISLSGGKSLAAVASNSSLSARVWPQVAQPADVQVTAAIYLTSLIPAQVLARGSGLNTATPTYYALALTRGLQLQLLRVVNGSATVLAQLTSASWFSDHWVRATLEVNGTGIKAKLLRTDTGQFLSSAGQWQSGDTWALTVTDSGITASGQVGLARPASYTGTINFDDFTITPLAAPPPPPPQGINETFDTTSTGTLPASWSQYSSDGSTAFRVTAGTALSPANSLTVTAATSGVSARAWLQAAQPADIQVTAAIYLNSLIPAQVLARGAALNTATPTYYALALTRGLQLQLLRVVNGSTTVLGQLNSTAWFSDHWVRATLYINGNNLRAQVYRPDTAQYLTSSGQWQASQTWALNLTDGGIVSGGLVGLARPASYVGTVAFDDFSTLPAGGDNVPPTVSIVSPTGSTALTGIVPVQVDAFDTGGSVTRVEFYLDDVLRAVSTAPPYRWDFDSSTAANGTHLLTVMAYDLAGNIGRASVSVTTSNDTALPRPTIPQHYSHIRIAQLAYQGMPFGAFEDSLLQSSVDLVVADQSLSQHIHDIVPNTPQAAYTNVSNLYSNLLTDWLADADAKGVDREAAFYHVTTLTNFSGNSPSSQPVNWFWGVYRGGATLSDVTDRSRGQATGGVAFGDSGEAVYVGYTDRFREINLNLSSPASGGWSAVLEYARAVDSVGNPTSWGTLTTLSNTTAGLTQSGQILFDPPSDWKAATVGASDRLFYVRIRTVSAGTAPTAATLLGRDYVGAGGTTQGTIPVFDSAADTNHDGYLNDTEYAQRAAGKNARYLYESRAFYPGYGQLRLVTNPSNLAFRSWVIDFNVRYLNAVPNTSALFVDNSNGNSPVAGMQVAEPTASYTTDYAGMLNALGRAIAPKWILANTVGGATNADAVIQHVQSYYEEFEIRPLAHTYQQFEEIAATMARRTALTAPAPFAVLDSMPTGGSPTDPRTQIATLAYYYLLADPATTFLDFFGGYAPATTWTQHWTAAAAYNIGQPGGPWSLFAVGPDPENTALTYRVYRRNFANALVLYKPLSTNLSGGQAGSLTSATTHALNGTFRPLLADGTLGAPVTSITLRNGEGAILIRS